MSRSNPTDHTPNPSQRWFEWDGSRGVVRYYDREKKETVEVGEKFSFIMLDQLATVKGWCEAMKAGIYANEVQNIAEEPLVVRTFKNADGNGITIAKGLYANIKSLIVAAGGHYTANCYMAFKDGDTLSIGSIQFKGAALSAWMDFSKRNRKALYEQGAAITGSTTGRKGAITFKVPTFALRELKPETNAQALELDKELQQYLNGYFSRKSTEQPVPTDGEEELPEEELEEANQHAAESATPFVDDTDGPDQPF